MSGVLLWAYERSSVVTVLILFALGSACAWLPREGLLAAASLSLFYPAYAVLRLILGLHSGNLPLFEFLGYLMFTLIGLLGYAVGRWLAKHMRRQPTGT